MKRGWGYSSGLVLFMSFVVTNTCQEQLKEGFILAHGLRGQSILAGRAWGQERETVTLYPQAGNRDRGTLLLSWEPKSWDGATCIILNVHDLQSPIKGERLPDCTRMMRLGWWDGSMGNAASHQA